MSSSNDYKLKVIEEINSLINGILLVTTNPILGLNVINSAKVAISGDSISDIFIKAIEKVKPQLAKVDTCLILGFGVGKTAKFIKNTYPNVNVTGIEIDPQMIAIGIKYFDLKKKDAEVMLIDAYKGCQKLKKKGCKFDLIVVDVFVGDTVPEKFERRKFILLVRDLLTTNGLVIFNRIYTKQDHKEKTDKFKSQTEKLFKDVESVKYKNNLLFICKNKIS